MAHDRFARTAALSTLMRPLAIALAAACLVFVASPGSAVAHPHEADSVLAAPLDSVPKRDIGDLLGRLIGREFETEVVTKPRPGLSFTLLPSLGYNPSYGAFIGVSASIAGWLGDPDSTTLSAASAGISYSTTGQTSIQFRSDFYSPGDRFALKGDWRYLDTSQPTFGLGPIEPDQSEYPMDFTLYRLYQAALLRVGRSRFYFGPGYHLDIHDEIVDERAEAGEVTPFSAYSRGTPSSTIASGLSANVLFDNRDNPINARRGVYWSMSLRGFATEIGSDDSWQSMSSDFRAYVRMPRGGPHVLAVWNSLWFTFGEAPYLTMPAIGWDTYGRGGRGYLQGRIRASDQIYTEVEYRYSPRADGLIGGVAFMNVTASTEPEAGEFGSGDIAGGIGLRVKFNKRTDTNLAVDAAMGEDHIVRLFFGLQEVF